MTTIASEVRGDGALLAIAQARNAGQRIVLAHGCWDLLHPGHLAHLAQARALGDVLVVSVTADRWVRKGPGRPVFPQDQRAAMLRALREVDAVVVTDAPSAVPAIEAVMPAVYVKGAEYQAEDTAGNLEAERAAVERAGGRLVYTDTPALSSSALINRHLPTLGDEPRRFLDGVRDRHGADGVLAWLDRAKALTATAVGEPIIDEYVYVEPEGRSAKEAVITYRRGDVVRFRGGVQIVADHLSEVVAGAFCEDGGMAPIVKRRWVVRPFITKVFAEVDAPEGPCPPIPWRDLRGDLVVVADYGHGLIPQREAARAVRELDRRFLALTVQSNSLNWGFNLVTKWPRADYVVIDEQEVRLAAADKDGGLEGLVRRLALALRARVFVCTLGHRGCLVYERAPDAFVRVPALADRVVDRMGAGDAFLAVTAPLACLGAPADVLGLVGNAAAGLKVGSIGNQPVTQPQLRGWIKGMLA